MASLTVLEPAAKNVEAIANENSEPSDKPEAGGFRETLDLAAFIIEPSPLGGGRPLTNDEFFNGLHFHREANERALVSLSSLARIGSQIQCVLHKIKLRRNVCIHSQKIREKLRLVATTLVSTSKGVFQFVFGDIHAYGNVNFDAPAVVTVQQKQVEAIAASVYAIQEEIACEKLNRVVAENAALGYRI